MNTFLYPIGAAKIRKKKKTKKRIKKDSGKREKTREKLFFIIGLLLPGQEQNKGLQSNFTTSKETNQ